MPKRSGLSVPAKLNVPVNKLFLMVTTLPVAEYTLIITRNYFLRNLENVFAF